MKILIDTYTKTGNLHHAYLLEGEREAIRSDLFGFIQNGLKISTVGNPDFWHTEHDTFTIDDARTLRQTQANKALSGDKKIFVIETRGMTVEAQNSLLKVFEEPTPHTHFFLIVPSAEIFLPTLRSRVALVSLHDTESKITNETKEFLGASIPDRLKIVGEIAEEKDKARAVTLIDGLLTKLHKNGEPAVLQELLKSRMYINDRSPSLKLLLEHIALIIPISTI